MVFAARLLVLYLPLRQGRNMALHPKLSPGHGAVNGNPSGLPHLSPYPVVWTFDMSDMKVKKTSTTPKNALPEAPPAALFGFSGCKKCPSGKGGNSWCLWKPVWFSLSACLVYSCVICCSWQCVGVCGMRIWNSSLFHSGTQLRRMGCPGCIPPSGRINNWDMRSCCPTQCRVQRLLVDWRAGEAVPVMGCLLFLCPNQV